MSLRLEIYDKKGKVVGTKIYAEPREVEDIGNQISEILGFSWAIYNRETEARIKEGGKYGKSK